MQLTRRKFLKGFILTSAYLLTGGLKVLSAKELLSTQDEVILRFAVGSDGHYGQTNTDYEQFFSEFVKNISTFHQEMPLNACIVNGDIIHDKQELLVEAKTSLDQLPVPYYVTQGNHDMVSVDYWNEVWNVPVNYEAIINDQVLLMMTTSNEKGKYLSPDLNWLKEKLKSHKKRNVFLFLHIGQQKWTSNCIDNKAYAELIKSHSNLKAVFHGHDHDLDDVKMVGKIPHLFDSHFGGNWGTPYRGYRILEVLKDNAIRTYIMNPVDKINLTTY
jgi:DNA repair exonuclease SbcCD nuclease subunit